MDVITKKSVPLILCVDRLTLYEFLAEFETMNVEQSKMDHFFREAFELGQFSEILWIKCL